MFQTEILAAPQPAGLLGWFQQLRGRLVLIEEHQSVAVGVEESGPLSATPAGPDDTCH